MGGLLKRERVTHIALFDSAPEGREGPWVTFARMSMLRTPKDLTGPELGVPARAEPGRDRTGEPRQGTTGGRVDVGRRTG